MSALGLMRIWGEWNVNTESNWTKNLKNVVGGSGWTQSIFDYHYVPDTNQDHVAITIQNKAWFLSELSQTQPRW